MVEKDSGTEDWGEEKEIGWWRCEKLICEGTLDSWGFAVC